MCAQHCRFEAINFKIKTMRTYLKRSIVVSIPLETIIEIIPLVITSYFLVYNIGKSNK
jgi:hypothetical protein